MKTVLRGMKAAAEKLLIAALICSILAGCAKTGTESTANESAQETSVEESTGDGLLQLLEGKTPVDLPDDVQNAENEEEPWKESYPEGLCMRFEGFDREQYMRYISHPDQKQVNPRVSQIGDIWLGLSGDSYLRDYCAYQDTNGEYDARTLFKALVRAAWYSSDAWIIPDQQTTFPASLEVMMQQADEMDVFLVESELYQWDYDGRGFQPYPGFSGPIHDQEYYLMRMMPKDADPSSDVVDYVMFHISTITNGGDMVYFKQGIEGDGVIATYDYMSRKLFREFLNDTDRYDYLMRDSNFYYEKLVDNIYSGMASATAVEAGAQVLGRQRTKELYIELLYRILAMQESGFDNCYDSMEKYDQISELEILQERAVDTAVSTFGEIGNENLAVNVSRGLIDYAFMIYGDSLANFVVDEIKAMISNAEEGLTLYRLMNSTGESIRFLNTIARYAQEPLLKEACEDLQHYEENLVNRVVHSMAKIGLQAAANFSKNIFDVDPNQLLEGILDGDKDEILEGVLKVVKDIDLKALKVLTGLGGADAVFELCIFGGDILFDTETQFARMAEIKALSDIAYAVRSAMYPLIHLEYTDDDLTQIRDFVYLGQVLTIIRATAEYSFKELASHNGGIFDFFNTKNSLFISQYYDESKNHWCKLYVDLASIITLDRKTVTTHYELSWGDGRGGGFSGGGGEGGGSGGGGGR
ncbi:MAG: hypothetical protein IJM90_04720 [Firmicutes bacterium]|nr:hypothetical protein [Bacillota bacterium]